MAISFDSNGMNLDFSNPTWKPSSSWFPITYLVPPSSCVIGGMFINTYNTTLSGNQYLPNGTYDLVGIGFINESSNSSYKTDSAFIRTGIAGGSNVAGSNSLTDPPYVGLLIRRA